MFYIAGEFYSLTNLTEQNGSDTVHKKYLSIIVC